MKRTVLYLLFALLMVSCGQPQTLSELSSEYVTIHDSIRVHYRVWNGADDSDTKTICFVHGFGCDMNTWEKQFETFRNDKDLRLVFIDLPGYGKSDKPHVEYTLDFFAHAIDEVLNANSIQNAVFVGHSLGTPVCRQTLMTTGHKGALVDVDGVYCFYDGTETPEYVEAVNQFGHAFDGPECRDVITGFVSSLAGKDSPQEITDYAMSVMPETPQYVASSTMQHLVERTWWPNRQISLSVMVICTQNSGLDPDNKQKMERLYPNLDYTELTTCGHFIHMEQPELFNGKLKTFINDKGGITLCDVPYSEDIKQFNADYLEVTRLAARTCKSTSLEDYMIIGTSALPHTELDGIVNQYSGRWNNPFLAWGKYRKGLFKTTLPISLQFHHAQMDGMQACRFLNNLQHEINSFCIE